MGAIIACQLSLQDPHLVKELMLFNMPVFASPAEVRQTYQHPGVLRKILLYTPAGRALWPIINFTAQTPFARMVKSSERTAFLSSSQNSHASRSRSLMNTLEATNGIKLLETITVPTQFVRGRFDRATPPTCPLALKYCGPQPDTTPPPILPMSFMNYSVSVTSRKLRLFLLQ
jgi:pimeloyl-ACP methyl ester carboxylesterase